MSNPEMLRRVMMANPQTREVMENNPEVAQMLNDPAFLRQVRPSFFYNTCTPRLLSPLHDVVVMNAVFPDC